MGSFNTTCFASNQTIAPKDACRVLVVSQSATYSPVRMTLKGEAFELFGPALSTCHPPAFWAPVTSWLPAVYDDYGQFSLQLDNRTRWRLLQFFGELLEHCPVVSEGENSVHDLAFDFADLLKTRAPLLAQALRGEGANVPASAAAERFDEELTECWAAVTAMMNEQRLFLRCRLGGVRPLQLAVVHDAAYRALVQSAAQGVDWNGETLEQDAAVRRMLRKAQLAARELPTNAGGGDMAAFWMASQLREDFNRVAQECGYPITTESRLLQRLCEGVVKGTLTEEDAAKTLRPLLDDRYAMVGLDALNLRFGPMVYAPQDYSNQLGRDYLAFVSTVCKQVTRGCDVQAYGPFMTYSVLAKDRFALEGADALARELDGRVDVVDVSPHPYVADHFQVTFQSPLDVESLKELLQQLSGSDGRVLLDMLVQLPQS